MGPEACAYFGCKVKDFFLFLQFFAVKICVKIYFFYNCLVNRSVSMGGESSRKGAEERREIYFISMISRFSPF